MEKLLSIYELQAVPGFDVSTIENLRPFVVVTEKKSDTRPLLQRIMEAENSHLVMRSERTLERSEGFKSIDSTSSPYKGDRSKIFSRLRISRSKDFSIGFTMEKDPGEQFTFDPETKDMVWIL